MKLFVVLICAHILGDFLLQPDTLAKNKHYFFVSFFHAAIHAFLVWLLAEVWLLWGLPAVVLLSHFLIDFSKQRVRDTAFAFVVDQVLHVIVLAAWAFVLYRCGYSERLGVLYRPLVFCSGFIATVQSSGFLIAKVAQQLVEENQLNLNGLKRGGMLIGQLERVLIFLLIYIGQPMGIGFLVAAKSILRFEEAKKQELAEYVLIGTFLSFSLAIALSTLTFKAMNL
ncbi:MAG: DUF3307 domain-containing protein [bacterium]